MTPQEQQIFKRLLTSLETLHRDLIKEEHSVLGYNRNGSHEPIIALVKDVDFDVIEDAKAMLRHNQNWIYPDTTIGDVVEEIGFLSKNIGANAY